MSSRTPRPGSTFNRNAELDEVLMPGGVEVQGDMELFRAYMRCFPF